MKIKEIAFVCYAVADVKLARKFYEETLGLVPGSEWIGEDMGFIEYELGPHTLAIGSGASYFKSGNLGATAALEVEDFDEAIKVLKEKGVPFAMEASDFPTCQMALINDPDGNQIMLHRRKAK